MQYWNYQTTRYIAELYFSYWCNLLLVEFYSLLIVMYHIATSKVRFSSSCLAADLVLILGSHGSKPTIALKFVHIFPFSFSFFTHLFFTNLFPYFFYFLFMFFFIWQSHFSLVVSLFCFSCYFPLYFLLLSFFFISHFIHFSFSFHSFLSFPLNFIFPSHYFFPRTLSPLIFSNLFISSKKVFATSSCLVKFFLTFQYH